MRNEKLGKRLRQMREEKKLGLKAAAPKANITYSYLSKIENGHKVPTPDLLQKLCKLYECDYEEVIAIYGALPDDIKTIIQKNGKDVFELLRKEFVRK